MRLTRLRSRTFVTTAATAALAVGCLGGTAFAAPASPAAAPAAPAAAPHPAPYYGPDLTGTPVPGILAAPGATPDAACTPYVDGDTAHITNGDASVHGWWLPGNCANQKAVVTVVLQEYFSDKTWHTQASGTKNGYPNSKSANRANARQTCEGVALAAWRSYVKVSVGNGASAYLPAENLNCTHW